MYHPPQQPKKNNRFTFTAAEPYPAIAVEQSNLQYAHLLAIDFASSKGELTAVTQYCYQSWVIETFSVTLADVLIKTAMIEMQHFAILGRCITALGGNPQYLTLQNKRPNFWTGKMVPYEQDARAILRKAINGEQCAIDLYSYHASLIQDKNISSIINRIILDEQLHLANFTTLLEKSC